MAGNVAGSQESGRTAAATTPAAGDTLVTLLEATSAVLTAAASGASLSLQASCGPGALTCAVQLAALLPQLLAAWTCGRSGSHSRDRALPNEHATDGGSAAVAAAPSAKPSQDGAAALQAELDAARGLHSTPEPVSQRSDLLPDMSEPQLAACMEELLQVWDITARFARSRPSCHGQRCSSMHTAVYVSSRVCICRSADASQTHSCGWVFGV